MRGKLNSGTVVFRLMSVLLILTLISIYICAGMYARYATSAEGRDSARVAKFTLRPGESFTTPDLVFSDMAPGESKTYSFSISLDTEVAVKCMATLSSTGNLPLSFKLDNSSITPGTAVELGTFAPNQGAVDMELTAAWPSSENSTNYLYEIDAVRLTISAEQVD